MITFNLASDGSVRAVTGSTSIAAFPTDMKKTDATLTFFSTPEEIPTDGTLSWPGEYERGGVAIRGVGHNEGGQVSFVMEMDGTRCAFLSSPLYDWSDHELEVLGDVDVLVIPAGEPKLAQKLIDEIDPRVLIPVPGSEDKFYNDLLKVSGGQNKEHLKEYKLKSLPAEDREVVVLE